MRQAAVLRDPQQVPHMELGGQRQGLKNLVLTQKHLALVCFTRFPGDAGLLKGHMSDKRGDRDTEEMAQQLKMH